MSQVRTVRMNHQMERCSGYERILAMQQAREEAEEAAREERPALAAIGLVLVVLGALAAIFSGGAFANGYGGATALLAVSGILLLMAGLAMVFFSEAWKPEPVVRHTRRYY